MKLDHETLESLRTSKRGFTKALTDELGIEYPYKPKWLRDLKKENRPITTAYYLYLKELSQIVKKKKP